MRRLLPAAFPAILAAGAIAADAGIMRTYDTARIRGAFLSRGAGARPAAMGGAFTGVADDASALAWNPGGLGQLSALSAVAQHDAAGGGVGVSSLSAALPVGEAVAGLGVALVSWGTLEYRDETGAPAGSESLLDAGLTQGWAFRNPRWLGGAGWSGVALELVQEARDTALVGFSAGSLIPLDDRFTFGWSILHAGPSAAGGALPRSLRVGSSYHGGSVEGVFDLAYGLTDHLLEAGAGGEYRLLPQLSVRAGWRQEGRGQGLGGLRGLTGGFGVRLGRFGLDYAYVPFGDLATTHRLSVEYRMPGAPRPAKLAAPVAPGTGAKPPVKRREPATKFMPALSGPDADRVSLKLPAVVPVRPAGPSATTTTGTPPRVEPAAETGTTTPFEDGPRTDPLLPPPAELEAPGDDVEGLRGGSRRGAGRMGTGGGAADSDAPLRGGR